MIESVGVDLFIAGSAFVGLLFGVFQIIKLRQVIVGEPEIDGTNILAARINNREYLNSLIGSKIRYEQRMVHGHMEDFPVDEGKHFNSWEEVV
jgi:hypothetical protein